MVDGMHEISATSYSLLSDLMLLQAFAREIGAVLINVRGSTLYSKWYGDSERLTAALFSLAAKLSAADLTTILFVDEVLPHSVSVTLPTPVLVLDALLVH
jgi:hypothetical protein